MLAVIVLVILAVMILIGGVVASRDAAATQGSEGTFELLPITATTS